VALPGSVGQRSTAGVAAPRRNTALPRSSMSDLRKIAARYLEDLQLAGITHVPRRSIAAASSPALLAGTSPPEVERSLSSMASVDAAEAGRASQPRLADAASGATFSPPQEAPQPRPAVAQQPTSLFAAAAQDAWGEESRWSEAHRRCALQALAQRVAGCTRCAELVENRTQTVFGVGSPRARLCFLGEAPGADEDRQGEPFVGRAGQLLDKIIEACTLRREDVYILNVLRCRPPNNRTPTAEEAAQCFEYLERTLQIVAPEYICCLGSVAAQTLLNTPLSLKNLRGRFYRYRGAKVLCTYHPAYLLRNPDAKRLVWEDMKLLMRDMGIDPQQRK
jgi:uracil-DNA glycosylase family 4